MPALMNQDAAAIAAAGGGGEKRAYVREIFSSIAPRYDFINHLMSFAIDRIWRKKAIKSLSPHRAGGVYLDLCAGTLDVSERIAMLPGFAGEVISADFAEPMLRAGLSKTKGRKISPVTADGLQLPLSDESLDGAIVAFGIRNVAGLDAGLNEVRRVLKPGAPFVILEFSTPRFPLIRWLYLLYFHHVIPLVGGLISGHHSAYSYLPQSVKAFPIEEELAARMQSAGFRDVTWSSLTFGIAAIHRGFRA